MLFTKPKTSSERIFQALKRAGKHGLYNYDLQKVGGLSWHRRIGDLRSDGYVIRSEQLKRGVFKYYLDLTK